MGHADIVNFLFGVKIDFMNMSNGIILFISLMMMPILLHCKPRKPNIIILLMDDMGWGDLGILGNPNKETPNIDRLANEGMLFTDFYAANPLCSPSRAALLTGRLPVRNGFYTTNARGRNAYTPQEIVGGINENEILLPELLLKGGYKTKIIGKWHLGHQKQYLPTNHGFNEFFGSTNVHFGPYDNKTIPNIAVFRNENMIGRYYEDFPITGGISNYTSLLIQEALSYIVQFSNSTDPFFLYWCPDNMHGPVYSSEKFANKSPKGRYGDSILEVDYGIGKMLDLLKKTGLENDTFIFFSSDNGPALVDKSQAGSAGPFLCGKQTTFEGGMRVPGIAWWPSVISSNQVTHQLASVMDLFSTVLEIAEISPPSDRVIDGISLVPLFQSGYIKKRPIFFYRGNELFAVRFGLYKIHLWTWTNSIEEFETGIDFCPGECIENVTTHTQMNHTDHPILFHLGNDPSEHYKLNINSDQYKKVLLLFKSIIQNHRAELVYGTPQLNWCDKAVMHWAPPGCEQLNKCLPVPKSNPYKCDWPH